MAILMKVIYLKINLNTECHLIETLKTYNI